MKPWLNGDFAGMDPRVSLDALRDVVQSASHRGLDLHPFWLGLGQKDPIVCADLAVGPKAVAHPAAIESALVVIEVLEQVVAPSGLYMRLLQLSPASSEALTVLAATRHPTQPWIWRLDQSAVRGRIILETHADTPVYEQSCRRACLLGCDGAIAEQVLGIHMPTVLRVVHTARGHLAALNVAKVALSRHEATHVLAILAALTGPLFVDIVSILQREPQQRIPPEVLQAIATEYLQDPFG